MRSKGFAGYRQLVNLTIINCFIIYNEIPNVICIIVVNFSPDKMFYIFLESEEDED